MKHFEPQKYSISEIKHIASRLDDGDRPAFIAALTSDDRNACQTLARSLEKKEAAFQKERQRMAMIFEYEQDAFLKGHQFVAGLDEAGRGPLVGSVVAAAVVLSTGTDWTGIDDSKKLTSEKRNYFFDRIVNEAVAYGIGVASHEEIDTINILNATKLAMKRALEAMNITPDLLLIDAVKLDEINVKQISLIKGDSKSASIAAASILAKVTRDRMMDALHEQHPHYGFDQHKGYGTDKHYDAIRKHGLISEHRRTFLKGINGL